MAQICQSPFNPFDIGQIYMVIYRVTNKIDGKEYIGQTVFTMEKRKREHIWDVLSKRDNGYFHRAVRKYGPDNFVWKILTDCDTIEELNRLEVYYIKLYDTYDNGYNLTKGGNGSVGWIPSEDIRKRMSKAQKGKKLSEEHKRKMSKAIKGEKHYNYGKKYSEEYKQKLSEIHKGKVISEETKRKLSDALKGRRSGKDNPAARAVIVNNKYFDTSREAAKYLNVSPTAIYDRIKRQVPGYKYAQI